MEVPFVWLFTRVQLAKHQVDLHRPEPHKGDGICSPHIFSLAMLVEACPLAMEHPDVGLSHTLSITFPSWTHVHSTMDPFWLSGTWPVWLPCQHITPFLFFNAFGCEVWSCKYLRVQFPTKSYFLSSCVSIKVGGSSSFPSAAFLPAPSPNMANLRPGVCHIFSSLQLVHSCRQIWTGKSEAQVSLAIWCCKALSFSFCGACQCFSEPGFPLTPPLIWSNF